ncbi:family 10 glycosylhydrolase, partial [Streptomyces sp. NPDC006668]|uniref:family 10 glycosylhydrolase n=1 Tax=Streptomyces sp. NPDC006668 TaxID=3156903 RepID=UPI0033EBC4AA
RKWVREHWIDYICPQIYWNIGFAAADYAKLVPWWAEVAKGTPTQLYIGEALYKAGDPAQPAAWQDPAELSRHLTLAAKYPQVRGHAFFAAGDVARDRIGAMARVVADHYRRPARPPR